MPLPTPETLLSQDQVEKRVSALARQISEDYADVEELYILGVLRGAFIFLADLSRSLSIPNRVDFIALSSYEDASTSSSSGAVRLVLDVRSPIKGKHVLIVEDIVDTGYTLEYLLKNLGAREPASLKTCVLLQKPDRLEVPTTIDYLGFEIPDKWVVGYGLDWADRYRTLPYIGYVEPVDD